MGPTDARAASTDSVPGTRYEAGAISSAEAAVRSDSLFHASRQAVYAATDRLFLWLMLFQWGLALAIALRWPGGASDLVRVQQVELATTGGAFLALPPLVLVWSRPGEPLTRVVVTFAQVGWSFLLVALTGGRAETWFHAFVSLAFLAFYRDWRLLVLAMAAGLGGYAAQHGLWSVAEHGGWLGFEGLVLADGAVRSAREMRQTAERQASFEALHLSIGDQVLAKTAELEASNQRYRALVEGSHAIPWELDPARMRFTYLSPRAEALTGLTHGQLTTGRTVENLIHPDDRIRVRGQLFALLEGPEGRTLDFECRMLTTAGHTIEVRSLVSRSAATGSLLGLSFDVTTTKKLELELRQAQKLESVGRLAAGVAHEINTPVQFVSDSVHFVRDAANDLAGLVARYREVVEALPGDDPRRRAVAEAEEAADLDYVLEQLPRALERSLEGLQRVATIVRSMKDFAHPDQTEMAPVDLNRGVQSTLTIARNEYKYVADLDVELGDLPLVTCHGGDVNQVILNLVVNAAHAIETKVAGTGERGRIGVKTYADGADVVIEVADTGTGIPEALRERIFDPFFTTKPVGKGTGQGLAISRSVIAEKHGGSIDFTSEVGRGTTFRVRLPVQGRGREAA